MNVHACLIRFSVQAQHKHRGLHLFSCSNADCHVGSDQGAAIIGGPAAAAATCLQLFEGKASLPFLLMPNWAIRVIAITCIVLKQGVLDLAGF